jgi:Flp pilus assembly pilin Flp
MRLFKKISFRKGLRCVRGESGQGLAEYALILAFIAIVCAAALGSLGSTIAASPAWTIFG